MNDQPNPSDSTTPDATASSERTPDEIATNRATTQSTPLRCLTGSIMAGTLTFGMYSLTQAIAQSFAAHPLHTTNLTVQRLSSAVRTLVIGLTTMGTGVFGLAALGLLALAIQLLIQHLKQPPSTQT